MSGTKIPLKYFGGKATIAKWIISYFPSDYETLRYVEPFAGGLSVFFRKLPSKSEVISDINKNLYIFYRVLREKPDKLQDALEKTLYHEAEFKRAKLIYDGKEKPTSVIDWARAVFIAHNMSFSGSPAKGFVISTSTQIKDINNRIINFPAFHDKVKNVNIICSDYKSILKKFNREDTLFYLDPPYPNTEQSYNANTFTQKHFLNLLGFLKVTRAKFVLSCHEKNLPKELPENWNVKFKDKNVTMKFNSLQRDYKEALVRNFS